MINLINITINYYLIGPTIFISLMSLYCENNMHKYLNVLCFHNSKHLIILILSFLMSLLYILVSFIFSFFYYQIGLIGIDFNNGLVRTFSNYELFCLVLKIIIFIFRFLLTRKSNMIYKIIYEIFIILNCFIMSIYSYKNVFYFNNCINNINHIGWNISCWFSICILLKNLLNIKVISISIIVGSFLIIIISIEIQKINQHPLFYDKKNFEFKNIINIEILKNNLLTNLYETNNKSELLIIEFIIEFEQFLQNNPELNDYYNLLLNDINLNKRFNKINELKIMSIIFILYLFNLEKFSYKEEIVLCFCYFLINKFKNPTYSMLLCSKLKSETFKGLYYKYLLIEDIKKYLNVRLNKKVNKSSIKYCEIGNIILFNLYSNLLKIRIYDALYYQIDYFDLLKNKNSSKKIVENFMKLGENILNCRGDIISIWGKINELNPFDKEIKRNYFLYINNIIEDEFLLNELNIYYSLLKYNKKNNINYKFLYNDSNSVLLIDGFMSNGRILYYSENFSLLFSFNEKEILNIALDDLLPNSIQPFHKELIEKAIKYSNINYIFNKSKKSLLKNKNGEIFSIKLFVKPVPNLFYGLIYYAFLEKIQQSRLIIELDKNFKIYGLTDPAKVDSFIINNTFNLNQKIYGHHISFIIPEILILLEYNNEEFVFTKEDQELKGYLYPFADKKGIKSSIDIILKKIKEGDEKENIIKDYNSLMKEIRIQNKKPLLIFYKVKLISFLEGKYKYYKVYISNDIISDNNLNYESGKDRNYFSEKSKKSITGLKINRNIEKGEEECCTNSINEGKKDFIVNKKNEANNNNIFQENPENEISINEFNKIKNNILGKKEFYSLTILKYICFLFGIFIIILMFFDFFQKKVAFNNLSKFLEENLIFNETKIIIAVLYTISVNLKWVSDSLYINSTYCPTYNWSQFYKVVFKENIDSLENQRKIFYRIGKDFNAKFNERRIINLYIYKYNETVKYNFNIDNILVFLINNQIKILDKYHYFTNVTTCKEISKELGLNEIDLKNLIEVSYYIYNSNFDGFKGKEKIIKINYIFYKFPFSFLFSGIILVIMFSLYVYYILYFHKLEINFLLKLINFHSPQFDKYIKKLDEIKSQLKTSNKDDDDKEEIFEFNNSDSKNHSLEKIELSAKEVKNKEKSKKVKNKVFKNKKKKIKIMSSFFTRKNILFGIQIILILLISLTYYFFSFLISFFNKNKYLIFDSIIISINKAFIDTFDIFIPIKRELELYEKNLINCTSLGQNYYLNLPNVSNIALPKLDNFIMQILDDKDFKKETRLTFQNLFNHNLCIDPNIPEKSYKFCANFWSGVLLKGIIQSISYMGSIIGQVLDELEALNRNDNRKNLFKLLNESSFMKYQIFNEFYLHKIYIKTKTIFSKLKYEKTNAIIKRLLFILVIYLIIAIFIISILYYFIITYNSIFTSFIKFIGIYPKKYIRENNSLYKDIISFGNNFD